MNAKQANHKPFFIQQNLRNNRSYVDSEQSKIYARKQQSSFILQKIDKKKEKIFPKQYTNKYFRTNSLYEEKQNQKIMQLHRLYSFMRKNSVAKKLRALKLNNCVTQPNQPDNILHSTNDFNYNSVRHNITSFENSCYHQKNSKTASIPIRQANLERRKPLKQISFNTSSFERTCQNSSKQKISTSRALQKYAKIIKYDLFHTTKSNIFDPPKCQRRLQYCSNLQSKQMMLFTKQSNQQARHKIKKYAPKKILGEAETSKNENFDIKGWDVSP